MSNYILYVCAMCSLNCKIALLAVGDNVVVSKLMAILGEVVFSELSLVSLTQNNSVTAPGFVLPGNVLTVSHHNET